jgi:hypothetical protein
MLLETSAQALADYRAQYGDEAEALLRERENIHGPPDTIWEPIPVAKSGTTSGSTDESLKRFLKVTSLL